jgi:ribosome biogenesis GTPase / thiamine phosphate phosphatase
VTSGLQTCGWTAAVGERYLASGLLTAGTDPGRVVRAGRGGGTVALPDGQVEAAWAPMLDTTPATGDWVVVARDEDPPLVTAILPRTTALERRDPSLRHAQVLAANLDVVFIVHALDRPLSPGRIERALVLAWDSGADPVVVLTKEDLVEDPGEMVDLIGVIAPGVPVVTTRSDDPARFEALRRYLDGGRTAAAIGPSGAGKSTLVNLLVGSEVQQTGAVRDRDRKGRHTTTARELVPVPGGGVLLDTPGVRELGLWVAEDGLERVYAEIVALAEDCRFVDCTHGDEPGCAVVAAVERGEVDPRRLERAHAMLDELHEAGQRRLERARRAKGRPPPRRGGRDSRGR